MNIYWILILLAACSALAHALCLAMFWRQLQRNGNNAEPYQEALRLWKTNKSQIDELLQRNITQLGSVRERLASLEKKVDKFNVGVSLDEIAKQLRSCHESRHTSCVDHRNNDGRPTFGGLPSTVPPCEESKATPFISLVSEVATKVDSGTPLNDLLEFIYNEVRALVPCQRMGYAEIDYEADLVKAIWSRSERPAKLKVGYSAKLSTSSLRLIAKLNRPRTLDLNRYLREHPESRNTKLIVSEGFASSLTIPVVESESVVGFLFLSSIFPDAFDNETIKQTSAVVAQISRAVANARRLGSLSPKSGSNLDLCRN